MIARGEGAPRQLVCLDLFSGHGGFSQAFKDAGWKVITLDNDSKFKPDICMDVLDVTPDRLMVQLGEHDRYDLVLASVPCTAFSIAASRFNHWSEDGEPQTHAAREALKILNHTMSLIHALNPEWWFVENPRGHMRKVFPFGFPRVSITLCSYGYEHGQKPTDLWGGFPMTWVPRSPCPPGGECHAGRRTADSVRDPAERSRLPTQLGAEIEASIQLPGSREPWITIHDFAEGNPGPWV